MTYLENSDLDRTAATRVSYLVYKEYMDSPAYRRKLAWDKIISRNRDKIRMGNHPYNQTLSDKDKIRTIRSTTVKLGFNEGIVLN